MTAVVFWISCQLAVTLPPLVTVNDVGLSDHHLLEWSVDVAKPTPAVVSVTR